jgi:hypothetical protein
MKGAGAYCVGAPSVIILKPSQIFPPSMLGNGAPCCSVSDGGKQFWHPEDVPVIWEGSITVGGRVGFRTPSCVQVLVSGAEDLARTACSTFP